MFKSTPNPEPPPPPPPPPQKRRQGKNITSEVSLLSCPLVLVATLVITPGKVVVLETAKPGNSKNWVKPE